MRGRMSPRPSRAASTGLAVALTVLLLVAGGAEGGGFDFDASIRLAKQFGQDALAWYEKTPAAERMTWGGLVAAGSLGLGVLFERTLRLRRRRIVPDEFTSRFLNRLLDGKLDRGKALDFCELNPSPASRVALAAVRRWGRPVTDLERAVALAHRVEAARLRRNVGTLRRVAALAPLLGLLGTLVMVGRALAGVENGLAWGPALASALFPLTASVALATLALVAYDGLAGRVESLVGDLDRVGAETIDAVAMALPLETVTRIGSGPLSMQGSGSGHSGNPNASSSSARPAHQIRMEVPTPTPTPKPKPLPRAPIDDEDDFD